MTLDAMFLAAHPDDVELTAGGTVAKLTRLGYKVGICDLTRGEAGTRGNADLRDREAEEAAKILGVAVRVNLRIPDTQIEVNRENQLKIIEVLRKYRPEYVFIPYWEDRHPDHMRASDVIREAAFYSGLARIVTTENGQPQEAFRPKRTLFCAARYDFPRSAGTTIVVDISDTFDVKMKAMEAFSSQFYHPTYQSEEPQTFISTPEFREALEARARHYGSLIDARYGEPFLSVEHLGVSDPIRLLRDSAQDVNKLGFA